MNYAGTTGDIGSKVLDLERRVLALEAPPTSVSDGNGFDLINSWIDGSIEPVRAYAWPDGRCWLYGGLDATSSTAQGAFYLPQEFHPNAIVYAPIFTTSSGTNHYDMYVCIQTDGLVSFDAGVVGASISLWINASWYTKYPAELGRI